MIPFIFVERLGELHAMFEPFRIEKHGNYQEYLIGVFSGAMLLAQRYPEIGRMITDQSVVSLGSFPKMTDDSFEECNKVFEENVGRWSYKRH